MEYVMSTMKNMHDFRHSDVFCDVKIQVENEIFPCQKVVLCASAEYFKKMFLGDFKESVEEIIVLKDVSKDAFAVILDFIYTGEVFLDLKTVMKIWSAAKYIGIECLAKKCIEYVKENTTVHNVIHLFSESMEMKLDEIGEYLEGFICSNFGAITRDENLYQTSYPVFRLLISKIRTKHTFYAIMKWISLDIENRVEYISVLLEGMRLQFVNYRDVVFDVVRSANNMDQIKTVLDTLATSSNHFVHDIHVFGIEHESNRILAQSYTGSSLKPISYMKDSLMAQKFSVTKLKQYTFLLSSYNNSVSYYAYDNAFGNNWLLLRGPNGYCHKLATYDKGDCIYGFHGMSYEFEYCINFYNYTPEVDKWYKMPFVNKWEVSKYTELVAHGGKIYFFGNVRRHNAYISFDPRSGMWTNFPRRSLNTTAAAVLNNRVYFTGSYLSNKHVYFFDITAGKWDQANDMRYERQCHSLVAYKHKLYAFGGNQVVEIYDPKVNTWTTNICLNKGIDNVRAIVC